MSNGFFSASEAAKYGSNSIVVLREISMIQEEIIKAVSCNPVGSCVKTCVTIEGNTPMTYYGVIDSVEVSDAGTGYYPVVAEVEFQNTGTGTGSGATADLDIEDGVITAIQITSGGSDYIDGETEIHIVHPQGQDFQAELTIVSGEITDIDITDGGIGYEPLFPELRLINEDGGTGAELIPEVDLGSGSITSVSIVNGGKGYGPNTEIEIINAPTNSGTGASLVPKISPKPIEGVDPYKYYSYLSGQGSSCGARSQVNQILSYFRSKDYTVTASVNPDTNKTIIWEVCWC